MNCMSFLHYIWSGSKPKTKMCSCLRTTLLNFFDPLHMLNTAHDWLSFKSLSRIYFSAIYTVIYLLQFLWSYYYVAILPLYKIEYIYFYSINNPLILSTSDTVYGQLVCLFLLWHWKLQHSGSVVSFHSWMGLYSQSVNKIIQMSLFYSHLLCSRMSQSFWMNQCSEWFKWLTPKDSHWPPLTGIMM